MCVYVQHLWGRESEVFGWSVFVWLEYLHQVDTTSHEHRTIAGQLLALFFMVHVYMANRITHLESNGKKMSGVKIMNLIWDAWGGGGGGVNMHWNHSPHRIAFGYTVNLKKRNMEGGRSVNTGWQNYRFVLLFLINMRYLNLAVELVSYSHSTHSHTQLHCVV